MIGKCTKKVYPREAERKWNVEWLVTPEDCVWINLSRHSPPPLFPHAEIERKIRGKNYWRQLRTMRTLLRDRLVNGMYGRRLDSAGWGGLGTSRLASCRRPGAQRCFTVRERKLHSCRHFVAENDFRFFGPRRKFSCFLEDMDLID